MKILGRPYYFKESTLTNFQIEPDALAVVRDEEVWSYLVPASDNETENFKIFSFHFKDDFDHSGFAGWLAKELGSGVFVVCSENSNKGGIFYYWGCPIKIADGVLAFLKKLAM